MPKAERQSDHGEGKINSKLEKSVGTLREGLNSLKKPQGLSLSFHKELESIETAMELCTNAMRLLSTDYIQHLETFKNEKSPLASLAALDASEEIWKQETGVIREHKKEINEEEFLQRMRNQAIMVFDNKLIELTSQRKQKPSDEEIALCLAILGATDQAFAELGFPKASTERKRLSETAKAFR